MGLDIGVESKESVPGATPDTLREAVTSLSDTSAIVTDRTEEPSLNSPIGPDGSIGGLFSGDPLENEPVKRKRGRPSRADMAARLNGVTMAPEKAPARPPIVSQTVFVDYETLGKMAANLWCNCGELILGSDWQPIEGEPLVLKNAFRDYFKEAGIQNISPSWSLGIVLFTYSASRVTKPTVKSRMMGGWLWLKSKIRR